MIRSLTLLVTLSIFIIHPAAVSYAGQKEAAPPNIIFVLADDLGWAELGCYDNKFNETPHVDRLAKQGMRFTQAHRGFHDRAIGVVQPAPRPRRKE